jgi:hypothetical protein
MKCLPERKCRFGETRGNHGGVHEIPQASFLSELVKKADLRVDDGHIRVSMRLRRDKLTREKYVVLGLVATTNYKHAELSVDEFCQFIEAAKSMQQALGVAEPVPPLKS